MKPTNKVVAGALAGAVTVILVWAAKQYGHVELPGEVSSAVTTVLSAVAAYFVPDSTTEG